MKEAPSKQKCEMTGAAKSLLPKLISLNEMTCAHYRSHPPRQGTAGGCFVHCRRPHNLDHLMPEASRSAVVTCTRCREHADHAHFTNPLDLAHIVWNA